MSINAVQPIVPAMQKARHNAVSRSYPRDRSPPTLLPISRDERGRTNELLAGCTSRPILQHVVLGGFILCPPPSS